MEKCQKGDSVKQVIARKGVEDNKVELFWSFIIDIFTTFNAIKYLKCFIQIPSIKNHFMLQNRMK